MQKVQTRELGDSEPTAIDDWQVSEVSFTTVRPLRDHGRPGLRAGIGDAGRGCQAGRTPLPHGQGPAVDGAADDARPGKHHPPSAALRRPERLPALDLYDEPRLRSRV